VTGGARSLTGNDLISRSTYSELTPAGKVPSICESEFLLDHAAISFTSGYTGVAGTAGGVGRGRFADRLLGAYRNSADLDPLCLVRATGGKAGQHVMSLRRSWWRRTVRPPTTATAVKGPGRSQW